MSVPPIGLPVDGPLHAKGWVRPAGNTEFRVTQSYGDINKAVSRAIHGGTDMGSGQLPGRKVYAPDAGTVIDEGWLFGPWSQATSDALKARWNGSPNWGGVMAAIRLSPDYIWVGAHLADTVINKGQKVAAGQLVGHVGNTGAAYQYGTHLHNDLYRRLATGESSGELAAISYGGYRWRKVDMWPLLAQNYVIPPDTSISEEIPMWVNDITPVNPPYWAVIGPSTNVRTAPFLVDGTISFMTDPDPDKAVSVLVIGTVQGDEANGSSSWIVYALNAGGLRVIHASQVIGTKAIASGPTAAQVQALIQEAVDPLQRRIAGIKQKVAATAADVAND